MKTTFHRYLCLFLTLLLAFTLTSCSANSASPSDSSTTGDQSTSDTDPIDPPPQFEVSAKARLAESEDRTWQTALEVHNSDVLEVQIQYVNTDTITEEDVNVRVELPANFTYIEGSTKLFNSIYPDGAQVNQDDIVTEEGIYLGTYAGRQDDNEHGANAYVRFSVKVEPNTQSGNHTFTISVSARRPDQVEPNSQTQFFTVTTPLASMP